MSDPIPLLLSIALITLIVLMILIGWQVFAILTELRTSAKTFNHMLDRIDRVSGSIESSIDRFSQLTSGIKSVLNVVNRFKLKSKEE